MCIRERLGGELRWPVNLALCGVSDVLMSLLGCMGWVYRRICVAKPNLRWKIASRLVFGIIYGAEICLLRKPLLH
jgi:hypothetical protein